MKRLQQWNSKWTTRRVLDHAISHAIWILSKYNMSTTSGTQIFLSKLFSGNLVILACLCSMRVPNYLLSDLHISFGFSFRDLFYAAGLCITFFLYLTPFFLSYITSFSSYQIRLWIISWVYTATQDRLHFLGIFRSKDYYPYFLKRHSPNSWSYCFICSVWKIELIIMSSIDIRNKDILFSILVDFMA